ncbi:SGNH/GDSL hydrolase family protein [Pseudoxanthomonas sp. CF125]|uniref:SGNH/GDSL hydrolase family protein n=1 Tax=Pseudoxanthomonas sp. CF125 TaxID=1855303 RepID=UPI0008858D0D|nr:SGNH/GDSL hydrolase family protein [Pseudoxanthomonas sp. CF125]SDQ75264.1 Lysophospholipase L1 [Pseudoxanthomonas sp. CF125]
MTELFRTAPGTTATELRYLALGDSYTIGEGVPESGRWPVQLADALRADGLPMADPRIIAQTGWTTDELDAAINAVHPLAEYDLVSLLIGVNNQYRGREVAEYRTQFSHLLERATGFAQWRRERVMVLSIPDWGITPFAVSDARGAERIGTEIDAFNLAARQVCGERGIAFVDITGASRERGAEVAMLADDGLHPSSAMYAQWTRLALPAARQLLATS